MEYFSFNSTTKAIQIDPSTPVGIYYKVKLTVTDDHATDPQSRDYLVNILVEEALVEEQTEQTSFDPQTEKTEKEVVSAAQQVILDQIALDQGLQPSFEIEELSELGLLSVRFSQSMKSI